MALFVTVPISTEVIESNADCALSGAYENGVLVITIDTRGQNVHQRLGLSSKTRLHTLAQSLWENRYLLFKAEKRMSPEEKQRLIEIVEADEQIGRLRAFLGGVWNIFEDSQHEEQARAALDTLKQMPRDQRHSKPFEKALRFLESHFEWMTEYLRKDGLRRNSLAESGMRVLRRLEIEHDGFRSEKGRDNCLRIYQAVKYLGWTVHQLPPPRAHPT